MGVQMWPGWGWALLLGLCTTPLQLLALEAALPWVLKALASSSGPFSLCLPLWV